MPIKTVTFDAYGTLFDVAAAARNLAERDGFEHLKDIWPSVANTWRLKQLQYSWLREITGTYTDFWSVTEDGLDFALEAHDLADTKTKSALLELYWSLAAYPEVVAVLKALKAGDIPTSILSNGSKDMLQAAVQSAGIEGYLDDILSVEDVGVFKPNDKVYQMVPDRFGCKADEILLVSSNGWDVAGGAGFGFKTLWVNRGNEPTDRLPHRPWKIARDLNSVPDIIAGAA
ncbi:MAG: haloacid dehalogenase type II [Pseudomonadota bacterium]